MSKSYRIRTTPGEDNGYLKVNLDINQNYDHLEILSLKISQIDDYQNFCSDYGVVAGRVDINNGFGVPNVKVSIFVPVEEVDLDDPVISKLYPYEDPFPDKKNVNGIRYNVLPKNKQTLDHTPVGTFPKKREVLDDETTLEIYEKYYKFTTTTNKSGDFILFGVPLGEHYLHYDCDLSDIGFISSRPYEMMSQGYSEDLFESRFKFKSSNNLDSLPQIFSGNIPITVEPFWCDSLSVGSALGINRQDISINYEVIPNAIFMGSIFSDDERDSLNKNCKPSREMGKMNEVITGSGKIEALRRNKDGGIEIFNFKDNAIDDNGNWSLLVPMNIRKVVTDEFGNLIPSPDGVAGIATEGDYRFRISMDATSTDKKQRQRAKFLVPNTNNNFNFGEYSPEDIKYSTEFTINEQLSTITDGTPYENDLTNQYNYLEEFYPFRWKKVYTVKQYIGRMQKTPGFGFNQLTEKVLGDRARGFIGIKDIVNSEAVNKFPTSRFDTTVHPLYTVLCVLLSLVGHLAGFLNGIMQSINGSITKMCQIKIPVYIDINFGNEETSIAWKCIISNLACRNCKTICPSSEYGNLTANDPNDSFRCCGFYNQWAACPIGQSGLPHNSNASNGSYCVRDRFDTGNWWAPDYQEAFEKCPARGGYTTSSISFNSENLGNCCPACCVKIPLIKMRCKEEGYEESVTLTIAKNGGTDCNARYAKPFACKNCGGYQTQEIKDWTACLLEPVAVFLKMLKFDFYNDWVGGTLYFPLIKRDYKLKKNKRKNGQIKKDKFCDFDCRVIEGVTDFDFSTGTPPLPIYGTDFQGPDIYEQWRIVINPTPITTPSTLVVAGCTAKIGGRRVSDWYGTPENDAQTYNLNLATNELEFAGKDTNGDSCVIKFTSWSLLNTEFNTQSIDVTPQSKTEKNKHGKPQYIMSNNPSGENVWKNIGGHGHHRNICDITRMVERKEFFKTELDCTLPVDIDNVPGSKLLGDLGSGGVDYTKLPCSPNNVPFSNFPTPWEGCIDSNNIQWRTLTGPIDSGLSLWPVNSFLVFPPFGPCNGNPCPPKGNLGFCISDCKPDCGTNGVAPCRPTNIVPINNYNEWQILHGLVSWNDNEIYYTPRILRGDSKYNINEYKGNLLMPTTVMELGSSVYCDIDDVPFIIDQIPPTTFKASFEDQKFKIVPESAPNYMNITEMDDKKNSSINLRAYVEYSCIDVVCSNTSAPVNQSQVGVDMIDKNDIGVEIGTCFIRFEHDADLREYFCKRFNGFTRSTTTNEIGFHHQRPGSIEFDNDYQTYPEITLTEGYDLFYSLPDTNPTTWVKSEYNDGDSFIPGDGCGYYTNTAKTQTDYFYGLAPGQTSGFINYPNTDNVDGAAGTIDFGVDAQFSGGTDNTPGTDEINILNGSSVEDDPNNGDVSVKGIRHNRSQNPYYLYFGLIPGKTSLNKTVGKFFADKINAVTLQGIGASDGTVSQNINNQPNINNEEENPFTVFRTCLGDTLITPIVVGTPGTPGGTGTGTSSGTGTATTLPNAGNTGQPSGTGQPGGITGVIGISTGGDFITGQSLLTTNDTYTLCPNSSSVDPYGVSTMQGTITINTSNVTHLSVVIYGGDRNNNNQSYNYDTTVAGVTITYEPAAGGPSIPFYSKPLTNCFISDIPAAGSNNIPYPPLIITDPNSSTLQPGIYTYTIDANFQAYSSPLNNRLGDNISGTVEICIGDC